MAVTAKEASTIKAGIIVASAIPPFALWFLICVRPIRAQERVIRPNTPSAIDALRLLKQARLVDQMNSQSWSSGNPTLDHYYAAKVAEIDRLINALEKQRPVSLDAVDSALDNSGARQLGGSLWTVPDSRSF